MEIVARETDGKSYHTYKYGYDSIGIPAIDYDDESDKITKWQEGGETDSIDASKDIKILADKIQSQEPLIKYFLDGSRRVYKVDDISYNKQVFPVVAGQIGVGCCRRINKRIQPEKFLRKLVVALPDKSHADEWDDDAYFASKVQKINDSAILKKLHLTFDKIIPYKTISNTKKDVNFEDFGIAVIQDYMIESEKALVATLVKEHKLGQDAYLLKDGSLEYKIMKTGKEELREIQKIKNNYNWVIGVSKMFNPERCLDYTGKKNANYIADLPLYHRTPVARYRNSEIHGDVDFGVWYIRIRDKFKTKTPFDGVIKVEKIMMDNEFENGIDSDIVDLISANLINERTPTCYGTDRRWANHLYPVYLTETYVKSKYIGNELFLSLF